MTNFRIDGGSTGLGIKHFRTFKNLHGFSERETHGVVTDLLRGWVHTYHKGHEFSTPCIKVSRNFGKVGSSINFITEPTMVSKPMEITFILKKDITIDEWIKEEQVDANFKKYVQLIHSNA